MLQGGLLFAWCSAAFIRMYIYKRDGGTMAVLNCRAALLGGLNTKPDARNLNERSRCSL
jgi:hypothetical protein